MEEEISLRELIEILWKGKWIITSITVIALLISIIFSEYVFKPIYEAKAIIAVEKVNIPAMQGDGLEEIIDTILKSTEINVQSYANYVKSDAILAKVSNKLKASNRDISVNSLSNKVNASAIEYTNLLQIKVKDENRQRTADIANLLAEELVDSLSTVQKEHASKESLVLEGLCQEKLINLEKRQAELKEFLQQPDSVAELEAELNTALGLLADLQIRETNMRIEINNATIMIETIEDQLAGIPIKIELIDRDLTREELNPVYIELNKELELKKALVAQLRAEKESILEETAKISNAINELQITLADKKLKMDHLQLDLETAKENYLLLINKQEEQEYVETINSGNVPLRIVSMASVPQAPVAPRKALNLVVAGCLGLMLGVFVVFFRLYWVNSARGDQVIKSSSEVEY